MQLPLSRSKPPRPITVAGAIYPDDEVVIFSPATAIGVTLPSAAGQRNALYLYNTGANDDPITLTPSGGTINGGANFVWTGPDSGMLLIPDGVSNWLIVAQSIISDLATAIASAVSDSITQTITNGDTTHTPSGDAVFDALALKAAISGQIFSGLIKSSSPTAGIGYSTGAGGAQTQLTDKGTTVASNTVTTLITMNAAALNAGVIVSFTFTNTAIAATDHILINHESGGTVGSYTFAATPGGGTSTIFVRNATAGNLSEAIVIRVTIIKAVSA